jgi:acylphosphatase
MDSEGTNRTQRRVVFSGRVQGVGFRFRTDEIAHRYQVGGFVQNQPDGTVLLVVEGEQQEVDRMIDEVKSTMDGYIQAVAESPGQSTTEFEQFGIRR